MISWTSSKLKTFLPKKIPLRTSLVVQWIRICLPRQGGEVLVAQSCPALCESMDCSLPASSVHGILQARMNAGVGCHFLPQSIFPTQELNPCLLHLLH